MFYYGDRIERAQLSHIGRILTGMRRGGAMLTPTSTSRAGFTGK